MERHSCRPREGWQRIVEDQGLIWHTDQGDLYWDESAYYAFTLEEIERIEAASEAVYQLFLEAGARIVTDPELMTAFGIPAYCQPAIRAEWRNRPPSLDYGRLDFGYDGTGEPKLFEFNCDTPTAMLEAGVIQWNWKEDLFPEHDQFTSLHEKLIDRWRALASDLPDNQLWFTHIADALHEDTVTTTYMRELAAQAGLETHGVLIEDLGVDRDGRIVDADDQLISAIFKLYPWEWIVTEEFGPDVVRHLPDTYWIEPIWKMIWSNKAVLALLWDMFPGHPNLLSAALDPGAIGDSFAAKPFLSREGSNIALVQDGESLAHSGGGYGNGRFVYQQLYPLKDFGNGYPVLGSWIVGGEAAGMGIREDGLITGNRARFIPHVIRD
jgi:glutathionylspermidine synthase